MCKRDKNQREMAPKRKDKDNETVVKQKPDAIQADNEIFLQAFESEYGSEWNIQTKNTNRSHFWKNTLLVLRSSESEFNVH